MTPDVRKVNNNMEEIVAYFKVLYPSITQVRARTLSTVAV
jgi:hypothetical protein